MEEYKQLCLRSFSINRSGKVIQKQEQPMPRRITFEANLGKLQDMVDKCFDQSIQCAVQYYLQCVDGP